MINTNNQPDVVLIKIYNKLKETNLILWLKEDRYQINLYQLHHDLFSSQPNNKRILKKQLKYCFLNLSLQFKPILQNLKELTRIKKEIFKFIKEPFLKKERRI